MNSVYRSMHNAQPTPLTMPRLEPVGGGPGVTRPSPMSMPAVTKPASARVVNLVQIVDVSSSMSGDKLRAANSAASDCLNEISGQPIAERFYIGVVTFDGSARVLMPMSRMQVGVSPVVNAVLGNGSTNIKAAIELAIAELDIKAQGDRAAGMRPVSVVVLLSDGCANAGDPQPAADRARAAGIIVVTIAFGADADQQQLRRIATTPQHAYTAFDAGALRELFGRLGATLSQVAAAGGAIQHALATI